MQKKGKSGRFRDIPYLSVSNYVLCHSRNYGKWTLPTRYSSALDRSYLHSTDDIFNSISNFITVSILSHFSVVTQNGM